MCVLVGFLILFLPPGSHAIAMLGALCDGIRVHDLLKCSSHPACLYVVNNSCFCFLEYTSSFVTQSICLIFQISFTHVVWKHQFVHYPGLTGVESCRKDHRPQDHTFSKFWHLSQDHTYRLHSHDSSCSFMTQEFVYVSICLWIALAFCLWFDSVLISSRSPHRPWEHLPLE